jgi:ABC-type branched-subunit amino acid transport system substrate-binding protein
VKTGPGISGKTITLGVLTDLSGVFAVLGKSVTQGAQLYYNDLNAQGGICKRKIKLSIKDDGYDVQKAVGLYADMAPNVLGMEQLLGSPINAALKQNIETDKLFTVPVSWASTILDNPNNMIVGSTYDVEMINGIQFLVDQKKIKKGDTVGHIYLEGEYGANGLAGSKFAAQKLGLTIVPVQVKATESDMTSAIGQLKTAGVKAISLTTTPKQTASAVGVAAVSKFAVPFLGNNPVYSPLLLSTPVAPALEANLYIVGSSIPLSADNAEAKAVLAAFRAKYPGKPSNAGVTYGYGVAQIYAQTLKAACAKKDLSRTGIESAFRTLTNVDTKGIIAPLDYSKPGAIPARQTYIVRPSKATLAIDGLKIEKELFESPTAKLYTPSF